MTTAPPPPPTEARARHALYVRHLTTATRCACATGGLCPRGEELLVNADAAGWRADPW